MGKQEFLAALEAGLSGLPQRDIAERLAFYGEMIDDRMEEGLTEEEAVSGIGPVEDIVAQIVAEVPFSRIVREKVRTKRALKAWEMLLLALGSPLWVTLLLAAAIVILAAYVVVWALLISLCAVVLSSAACTLTGILSSVPFFFRGRVLSGIAMLGAGVFFAGASILLFFGCKQAARYILLLTKRVALGVKSLFIGREELS